MTAGNNSLSSSALFKGLFLLALFAVGLLATCMLFAVVLESVVISPLASVTPVVETYFPLLDKTQTWQQELLVRAQYYLALSQVVWPTWAIPISGLILTATAVIFMAKAWGKSDISSVYDVTMHKLEQEKYLRQKAEKTLSHFNQTFLESHENSHNGFMLIDPDLTIRHINQKGAFMLHFWSGQNISLMNRKLYDTFAPLKDTKLDEALKRCLSQEIAWEGEIHLSDKDIWVNFAVYPSTMGAFVEFRDISHRKSGDEALKSSHVILKQLMESTPLMLAVLDTNFQYLMASQEWIKTLQLPKDFTGKKHTELLPNILQDLTRLKKQLDEGQVMRAEKPQKVTINEQEEHITWEVRPWKTAYGEPGGYVLFVKIVTAQVQDELKEKQDREQEHLLAYHDTLTGLPNRQLFYDRLNMALARGYREMSRVAVMFMDLDGFKAINDTYGHDAGDLLLKEVAVRIKACVRETDTVSRLAGDEFTVIVSGASKMADISHIAQKIIDELAKPIDIGNGTTVSVTSSIGISQYPDDGSAAQELIKKADGAMYKAKNSGKNQYVYYKNLSKKDLEQPHG